MGKPTGFIEYLRELPLDRSATERIRDWNEFHFHMEEAKLRHLIGNLSALPDLRIQILSLRRGQDTLWLEVHLSEMKADLQGQYILSLRDVTQAKRAQAAALEEQMAAADFWKNQEKAQAVKAARRR
jgi:hypothetical protein